MDEQELKRKLAKRAGFQQSKDFDYLWYPPNREGGEYFTTETLPFLKSLDACFKWLVPKKLIWFSLRSLSDTNMKGVKPKKVYEAVVQEKVGTKPCSAIESNPALALCLAIEKLIDKEVPNEGNQNLNPKP